MKNRKLYVITILCLAIISAIVLASCTTTQAPLSQQDKPNLIPIEYGSADFIENAPKLATPSTSSFGIGTYDNPSFTTDTPDYDGVAYPYYYFDIPSAGAYELSIGRFDPPDSDTDTQMGAEYFGHMAPSSANSKGRFDTTTKGGKAATGWDQSAVFACVFYTNIKLNSGLTAVANTGNLKLTITSDVASKYFDAEGYGFYTSFGFTFTNNVTPYLLKTSDGVSENEVQPSGSNGGKGGEYGTAYQQVSKGQVCSNDLFTNDAKADHGNYVEQQDLSYSYTIEKNEYNLGNGGVRIHILMGSNKQSGFYFGNVRLNVEVMNPFEGAGTESNPYKIKNATDLQNMAAFVQYGNGYQSAYYKQTADIDLGGISNFTPIGVSPASGNVPPDGIPFTGVYDGNGYKIKILP